MLRLRLLGLVLVASSWANPVPIALRVQRDGSASATNWSGSDKQLPISGSATPTLAWMEFDGSPDTTSAKFTLKLQVLSVAQSGTLQVFALTNPVTSLENATQRTDLAVSGPVALGQIALTAGTAERMIELDLNRSGGLPYGLVLSSNDGLEAIVASKESDVPAVLVATQNLLDSGRGPQGPKGERGDQGPLGSQGPKGAVGVAGLAGPQGPIGLQGKPGLPGPAGDQGSIGAMGPQGTPGIPGNLGNTGPMGDQGAMGPTGLQGSTGPRGDVGNRGRSLGIAPTSLTTTLGRAGSDTVQFNVASGWDKFRLGDSVLLASTLIPSVGLHGRLVSYDSATGTGRIKPTWAQDTTTTHIPATPTSTSQWRVTALGEGLFLKGLAQVNDTLMLAANPGGGAAPTVGQLLSWDGNNWVAKDNATGFTGGNQPIDISNPYLGMNFSIALAGIFPTRNGQYAFLGEILISGINFAPTNYALCNGQILPINQNTALFSLLGIFYGGDGKTNFALPNLQGQTPMGMGSGPGLPILGIGEKGGNTSVTLLPSQLPAHSHTLSTIP